MELLTGARKSKRKSPFKHRHKEVASWRDSIRAALGRPEARSVSLHRARRVSCKDREGRSANCHKASAPDVARLNAAPRTNLSQPFERLRSLVPEEQNRAAGARAYTAAAVSSTRLGEEESGGYAGSVFLPRGTDALRL